MVNVILRQSGIAEGSGATESVSLGRGANPQREWSCSMENTLLVALSRQMALARELDVVANNMANVNTHGFRREQMQFGEYLMPVASADGFPRQDRTLSYVEDRSSFHDLEPGAQQQTDNPLDIAIQGDAFFTVQGPGGQGERYTRDGGFQIDAQGQLVTANGQAVLGDGGPIVLDPTDTNIVVARDGTVSTKDGVRGHLKLASFANPLALKKEGNNLFTTGVGQTATAPEAGSFRLAQGAIEASNVKPVLEMSRLIEINRAYASLTTIIQKNDDLRKTALQSLSEIPS
jgi:flagellar basal-body rod protein FlgF